MIAIGADHGGYKLKEKIKEYYKDKIDFLDCGTISTDSVDYPVIAHKVAEVVASGKCDAGILICRTGVGMSITANKTKGIRCALCFNKEVGRLCKEHNNANVIALPADMISFEDAIIIINNWINSEFIGERHQRRIDLIEEEQNGKSKN